MLIAGAAAFLPPHAGKPSSTIRLAPSKLSMPYAVADAPIGQVAVSTEFRLAPSAFDPLIEEAATAYGLDPILVRAVIATESAFDPMAVSHAGAQGLMQLMPALAQEMGVIDPFDPRENIMAGTRYLSALLDDHDGSVPLALASYNAGPGNVALYKGIPPFPETHRYVQTITRLVAQERADAPEQ
jgi:soluble lytic murein transglycosylase-like protein